MPGMCVIVGQSVPNDYSALLAAMSARMRHYDWYTEDRHTDPAVALAMARQSLGFVNRASQPARNEDGSLLVVMDGELYDAETLRQTLANAGHVIRTDSHAELLLHGYESGGKPFFVGLHGTFAAAIWDARNRRLVLTNDRFGMKPLYFAEAAGRLLVASEIKSLFADPAVSRTPNVRGMSQFFSFGQLLGEDTLFEGVRALPPAAWFTFDARDGRLTSDRYWRLAPVRSAAVSSTPELLNRVTDVFQAAVDRRVAGGNTLGISLSGGLDSRTILAVIDHQRIPISSVSMGIEGSLDHRSAEQMAALTNRRHHSCMLDARVLAQFLEQLKKMVHLTDGHYLSQGIMQYTLPTYQALGIQVLLRGHAGELMHMRKAYSFSLDERALALRSEVELEEWLMGRMRDFMVGNLSEPLLAGDTSGGMSGLARESLREALAESAGMEPLIERVSHLFVTERLRRETAMSMQEFGSIVETRLPFMDNDLIDVLFSMPPELKLRDDIEEYILRKKCPAFLDVTNANTGAKVGAGPWTRSLSTFALRVFGKLGVPGFQPYERLGLWLRRELRPLVEDLLLGSRFHDRGIFEAKTVRAIVDSHVNRGQNHTYLIMALMIFELGQREFLDGDDVRVS